MFIRTERRFSPTAFYDLQEQYTWKDLPLDVPPSESLLMRVHDKLLNPTYYNDYEDITDWGRSIKINLAVNLSTIYVNMPNKSCTMKTCADEIGVLLKLQSTIYASEPKKYIRNAVKVICH